MMRIVLLSLLVVIWLCQDVQASQYTQKTQSYEGLSIHRDYYHLKMSYNDNKSNIPKSLKNLIKKISITSLVLQMGFINPSALHMSRLLSSHAFSTFPINHGISLLINNSTQISHQNLHSLAQVFSISRDSQFLVHLPEVSTTYVSNPNDKFCAQHLKPIIDLFMPCKNAAGVGVVVNDKTFFVGKAFIGVKLEWKIGGNINLQFYLDKNTQQAKNYLKLTEEKRYFKRCMHFDQFQVSNQQKQHNSQLINNEGQKELPSIIYTSAISTEFHSNYYNPQKILYFHINLNQLREDILERSSLSDKSQLKTIKGRILFPKGFKIEKASYECISLCSLLFQRIEAEIQGKNCYKAQEIVENRNTLVKFQARLFTNESRGLQISSAPKEQHKNGHKQNSQLVLKIKYKSHIKPFEEYQTIAGGGQEFTNIPLTVEMDDRRKFIVKGHKNRNMFDRLLQPDFSIPFKTITFTIAIFGYLWIAIWKAYYSQVQKEKKIHTQQLKDKKDQ